jgi:hypothetical protein
LKINNDSYTNNNANNNKGNNFLNFNQNAQEVSIIQGNSDKITAGKDTSKM